MANNRFHLFCPVCLSTHYFAKCMAEGLYITGKWPEDASEHFGEMCQWVQEHIHSCYPKVKDNIGNTPFEIVNECDPRFIVTRQGLKHLVIYNKEKADG